MRPCSWAIGFYLLSTMPTAIKKEMRVDLPPVAPGGDQTCLEFVEIQGVPLRCWSPRRWEIP